MCGCLLCTSYWGPGPQPRHVPWPGIQLAILWFAGWHSIHWATPARVESYFLRWTNSLFLLQAHQATSWGMVSQVVACVQENKGLVKLTETSNTPDRCISQGKLFRCNSCWKSFPYDLIIGREGRDPWFGHSDLDLCISVYEWGSFLDRASILRIQTKSGVDHETMKTKP